MQHFVTRPKGKVGNYIGMYPEGTQLEVENRVLGAFRGCKVAKLTLHAELLGRIISLRDDLTYVVRPTSFV